MFVFSGENLSYPSILSCELAPGRVAREFLAGVAVILLIKQFALQLDEFALKPFYWRMGDLKMIKDSERNCSFPGTLEQIQKVKQFSVNKWMQRNYYRLKLVVPEDDLANSVLYTVSIEVQNNCADVCMMPLIL